ncbi:hypothetical protein QUB75_27140 [Microcoleus sp. K1-B6]|uniref:hypothetical protein n=1 Tax=unclassified Microcoleus TaxID=2642155 RepID=UPI002FD76EBB
MQITLVSSGDTVSDVLNRFQLEFSPNWVEIEEDFSRRMDLICNFLAGHSIGKLKAMTDFLDSAFKVDLAAPKRNSKISLASWVTKVLLSAREAVDASEAIADQAIDSSAPEVEVMEPEEKPIYTISILADGAFSEERVNRLPPFLIDRKGNLLKKFWHRSYDAGYSEITFKHLSNIAVNSGLVIRLMADNLEISQACIVGDPPPFIVDKGGVYKRDQVRRGLAVTYSQVISECLSHVAVVSL